jgi:hypothetical protein
MSCHVKQCCLCQPECFSCQIVSASILLFEHLEEISQVFGRGLDPQLGQRLDPAASVFIGGVDGNLVSAFSWCACRLLAKSFHVNVAI